MADKAISQLPAASSVESADLFVLEQTGAAKKLTGATLESWLLEMVDGHGGISDIELTSESGLEKEYTITYADEDSTTFTVTDGRGISSITWETSGDAGDGMVHTGTITYNDGTESTIEIQDGYKGDQGDTWYTWIKYSASEPVSDEEMTDTPSAWIGLYAGTSETAPTTYDSYTWFQWKGEKGDTGNGIASIAKSSASGAVDTYTVTMTDDTTTSFDVTNGSNIASITLAATSGLTDTYNVNLTNGNSTSFNVVNGKGIVSFELTGGSHAAGSNDTYTITYNDGDTQTIQIYNGANGTGSVSTVSGITAINGDVPQVTTGNGAPTPETVGQPNQIYVNLSDGKLYLCTGGTGGTHNWISAGSITVDTSLSTTSANPVQNSTITNKVGTVALNTTAQNLSGAVNEVNTNVGDLSNLTTTSKSSVVAAVNEVDGHANSAQSDATDALSNIGTLSNLTTTAKTNLVAAINEVDGDNKLITYTSVTQLGFTAGSATIAGVYGAMPYGSMLLAVASDFASGQTPSGWYGEVELVRMSNVRGRILAFGKTEASGNYLMYLDSSTNLPSGTWVRQVDRDSFVYDSIGISGISIGANADSGDQTYPISRSGYTPLCIAGSQLSGTGSGQTVAFRLTLNGAKTGIYYRIRNNGSAAVTVTLTVAVVWIKD